MAFLQELFELPDAVAAELFVLEINGVPGALFPVQNVNRPGFRVARNEQEQ